MGTDRTLHSRKSEEHVKFRDGSYNWVQNSFSSSPDLKCTKVCSYLMRFQVLAAARMNMTPFWDISPWSLVESDRRFSGGYCLRHQSEYYFYFLWNSAFRCRRRTQIEGVWEKCTGKNKYLDLRESNKVERTVNVGLYNLYFAQNIIRMIDSIWNQCDMYYAFKGCIKNFG
jgi:hypothetical protein